MDPEEHEVREAKFVVGRGELVIEARMVTLVKVLDGELVRETDLLCVRDVVLVTVRVTERVRVTDTVAEFDAKPLHCCRKPRRRMNQKWMLMGIVANALRWVGS